MQLPTYVQRRGPVYVWWRRVPQAGREKRHKIRKLICGRGSYPHISGWPFSSHDGLRRILLDE